MERVTGVLAVEDDLTAREPSPARDRDQQSHLLVRNVAQKAPLHAIDPM
jgi:hypothetical protein